MWWILFWVIVVLIGMHSLLAGVIFFVVAGALMLLCQGYVDTMKDYNRLLKRGAQCDELYNKYFSIFKENERLENLIKDGSIEKAQNDFEKTMLSYGYPGSLDPRQSAVYLKMKDWYRHLEEKSRHLDNKSIRRDWISYLESLEKSGSSRWMLGENYGRESENRINEKDYIEKVMTSENMIREIEERFPKLVGEDAVTELAELRVREFKYPSGVTCV